MKFVLNLLFFTASVSTAYAYIPEVIEQASLHDISTIDDPSLSQAFYGKLTGYPHTYEIRSKEPFELYVQILLPEIEGVSEELSGIVIKETGFRGRVSEVARLLGRDASWESFYEPWGGDYYRKGGELTQQVEAGVYRIEVSTPDNNTPYVLVIGKQEDSGGVGYFEMIKRIAAVKEFYGKSKFTVIQSPFVFGPLALMLVCGVAFYFYRHPRIFSNRDML